MGLDLRGGAHSAPAFPQYLADHGDPYTPLRPTEAGSCISKSIRLYTNATYKHTRNHTTYIHAYTHHIPMPRPHLASPKS